MVPEDRTHEGVFTLHACQPSARRVYQPAAFRDESRRPRP
jgi:hypothetical protein